MLIGLLTLVSILTLQVDDPNVIVILADDVGVDRIGAYGDAEAHTPTLDALAKAGAMFTSGYSETVCSPSRAALLTGTYPHRLGISNAILWNSFNPNAMLPLDAPSLPASLPDHYRSMVIGKWHLANKSAGMLHPLMMGFDTHRGTIANPGNVFLFGWFINGVKLPSFLTSYLLTFTVDAAIEEIEAQTSPYFMYLALHAPHKPLHNPPSELHTYGPTGGLPELQFRAYLEAMDTEIARLLKSVDWSNTYVIFMGDNGTIVEAIDPELPTQQSKGFVYEGGIHVPLIVVGPGIRPGTRPGLTHIVDVAPTIAELTGGSSVEFQDGRSFVDALFGTPAAGRSSAYWRRTAPDREEDALRFGDWKLVRDLVKRKVELYHLASDPGETKDLATTSPLVLTRMLNHIETFD